MVKIKLLPWLHQVVLDGDLTTVAEWLDTYGWTEATINIYCREDTSEIRANAVARDDNASL